MQTQLRRQEKNKSIKIKKIQKKKGKKNHRLNEIETMQPHEITLKMSGIYKLLRQEKSNTNQRPRK